MLSRYSHVRMEAKRRALDEIAARQGAGCRTTVDARGRFAPRPYVQPDRNHIHSAVGQFDAINPEMEHPNVLAIVNGIALPVLVLLCASHSRSWKTSLLSAKYAVKSRQKIVWSAGEHPPARLLLPGGLRPATRSTGNARGHSGPATAVQADGRDAGHAVAKSPQ
jgi:hypothetical protein